MLINPFFKMGNTFVFTICWSSWEGFTKPVFCTLSASVHEEQKSPYHTIEVQPSDDCLFVAFTRPCAS